MDDDLFGGGLSESSDDELSDKEDDKSANEAPKSNLDLLKEEPIVLKFEYLQTFMEIFRQEVKFTLSSDDLNSLDLPPSTSASDVASSATGALATMSTTAFDLLGDLDMPTELFVKATIEDNRGKRKVCFFVWCIFCFSF